MVGDGRIRGILKIEAQKSAILTRRGMGDNAGPGTSANEYGN
jgi:hypothetical protein